MNGFSFKIIIIVQDITGLVSLNLFHCDVKKLLQKTAQELLHQFYKVIDINFIYIELIYYFVYVIL